MSARARRGVLLVLAAVAVAALVVVLVTRYVGEVTSRVGDMTTVYRAAAAIEPYAALDEENLEAVEVPERWTSPASRVGAEELVGRRVGFAVEAGTVLSPDMLVPPSDLSSTEREIAVLVDPVTGLAGRVVPGDRVDLYAVYEDVPGLPRQVRVLVRDVRVVSLGGQQTVRTEEDGGLQEEEVVTATLALEPTDALAVTYANAFAAEVRLVALPTDVGLDRSEEIDSYDAGALGGQAVPEEVSR